MKLLLLLAFGIAVLPVISSTENEVSDSVVEVEAPTSDVTTASPVVGEINPTTEEAKNETEKGPKTSPKKMTCLPIKGLNVTSVSTYLLKTRNSVI